MSLHYIEVGYKPNVIDPIGNSVKADIAEDLLIEDVKSVSYVDVYKINSEMTNEELELLGKNLFSDPIIQNYSIDKQLIQDFDWEILVQFHADVTDNLGIVAVEGIEDILEKRLDKESGVRTGKKYLVKGRLQEKEIKKICSGLLANDVIENYSYRKGKK